MGYIRFFWTALFVVVAFIVSIPIMLIILFVGLFSMPLRDKMTIVVIINWYWLFGVLLVRWFIVGFLLFQVVLL